MTHQTKIRTQIQTSKKIFSSQITIKPPRSPVLSTKKAEVFPGKKADISRMGYLLRKCIPQVYANTDIIKAIYIVKFPNT